MCWEEGTVDGVLGAIQGLGPHGVLEGAPSGKGELLYLTQDGPVRMNVPIENKNAKSSISQGPWEAFCLAPILMV